MQRNVANSADPLFAISTVESKRLKTFQKSRPKPTPSTMLPSVLA